MPVRRALGCTGPHDVARPSRRRTNFRPGHCSPFDQYGELKEAVDAAIRVLTPVGNRYLSPSSDSHHVQAALRAGAKRARELAGEKVSRAKAAIGLLPA